MKTLLAAVVLWGAFQIVGNCEDDRKEKDPAEPIAVGMYFKEIEGTTLCTNEVFSSQEKSGWSSHSCSIGYRRENTEGNSMTFVSLLALPPLENDVYVVSFADGWINVMTKNGVSKIVKFNLEGLAPASITRKSRTGKEVSDQPGIDFKVDGGADGR